MFRTLQKELGEVEKVITRELKTGNKQMKKGVEHILSTSGKLLRPSLLLIGAKCGKSYSKKRESIIQLAASVELLHTATLLHDDVIDRATLRRNSPTMHSKYGEKYAIYMGDYLLSSCFLLLTDLNVPREVAIRLAKTVRRICSGEIKQDKNRYNTEVSIREFFRVVAGKTASLFSIALSAGAYISETHEEDVKKLAYIGFQIGMAFQLKDDLLDVISTHNELGKNIHSDFVNGYYTLPIILLLNRERSEADQLKSLLQRDLSAEDITTILEILHNSGVLEEVEELINRYYQRALKMAKKLQPSKGQELLIDEIIRIKEINPIKYKKKEKIK